MPHISSLKGVNIEDLKASMKAKKVTISKRIIYVDVPTADFNNYVKSEKLTFSPESLVQKLHRGLVKNLKSEGLLAKGENNHLTLANIKTTFIFIVADTKKAYSLLKKEFKKLGYVKKFKMHYIELCKYSNSGSVSVVSKWKKSKIETVISKRR